jgi:ParB family chromosome partitioning protein
VNPGESRLRAGKSAKFDIMPTIITQGNHPEIFLIENLQREDLDPIEEVEAMQRIFDEFEYAQQQVARIVGKERTTV